MREVSDVGLREVQAVYAGPERRLWELVMGQQIHLGGLRSSTALAERAGIGPGMSGVDLCCCTGAGMRFLVRFCKVDRMQGVDATAAMVELGRQRCREEGLAERIEFTLGDACETGLPTGGFDFVWGEDAWCYVVDKERLIAEAVRLVRRGGTIAFTDWVEGENPLSPGESQRWLHFMKFPSLMDLGGYAELLEANGCRVEAAEDTGVFAPCVDLYLNMLDQQLTYDALRILDFDAALMEAVAGEMKFTRELAHAGKIIQGRFVARKK